MKNPECLEWYKYAKMDLSAAQSLNEYHFPKPSEIICYHCQQCAEKMLKGFIISNAVVPPKIHDLLLLCNMCIEHDERFKTVYNICVFLDNFSVLPRYPNELEITEDDAKRALNYCEKIIEFYKECEIEI